MSWLNGTSYDELKELIDAARTNFRCGDITEEKFREQLARLGFNATEIDQEVLENDQSLD